MGKKGIWVGAISIGALLLYGIGRLYFLLTAGFTEGNIASDFSFQRQWEVRPLEEAKYNEMKEALRQPYAYLGKGCQSYVFASQDGRYVLKFFKHQRYRLPSWLLYAPPLPALVQYREEKREKKWKKFNRFAQSWKLAYEELPEETGLLCVHLNPTHQLHETIILYDKLGMRHEVDLDTVTFCLQRKAVPLCETLLSYRERGEGKQAKETIEMLLQLLLSEYERGLADNDHALMQNTGILEGKPIHIDVGQFVRNEEAKNPEVYRQELFAKTYKFTLWLKENDPELALFLEERVKEIVGPSYSSLTPKKGQLIGEE